MKTSDLALLVAGVCGAAIVLGIQAGMRDYKLAELTQQDSDQQHKEDLDQLDEALAFEELRHTAVIESLTLEGLTNKEIVSAAIFGSIQKEHWIPTKLLAQTWIDQRCPSLDVDQIWNEETRFVFAECCEIFAIREFVLEYGDRELMRWRAGETSVDLRQEIKGVESILSRDFGLDLWNSIDDYSRKVIDCIRTDGTIDGSETSRWKVFTELKAASCFETLEGIIESLCID
jgi:hypothetical protein